MTCLPDGSKHPSKMDLSESNALVGLNIRYTGSLTLIDAGVQSCVSFRQIIKNFRDIFGLAYNGSVESQRQCFGVGKSWVV